MAKCIKLAVAAIPFLLMACGSYQPFDYQNHDNGMAGPGLLSGKRGEFVIYRQADEPKDPASEKSTARN